MSCCPTCNQSVQPHQLLVSLDTHEVTRNGVTVKLTPQEAELLFLLDAKSPATASIHYLLDGIYGLFGEAPQDGYGVLKVAISHLRQKLAVLDDVRIETIHKVGYRLEVSRISMRDALELATATLSRFGLSAPEIALAEAIAKPGQAHSELAIIVRRRVGAIRQRMTRNGLFARNRAPRT